MIFKIWKTFETYNKTGAAATLTYTSEIVPFFIPLLLFCLYVIVLLSTYYFAKRTGGGNFFGSMAVAGYIATITAFSMTLIDNLISPITVVTCLVVAIIGTLLFLFQER